MSRSVFAVVLALAVWWWPDLAAACKCGPGTTTVHPPALHADSSEVRARYDSITVQCRDRELQDCTWHQEHTISNGGEEPARVYGTAGDALDDPEVRVHRGDWRDGDDAPGEVVTPDAVELVLAPGESVDMVVTGTFSFTEHACGCWAPGIARRHPVVSKDTDSTWNLTYSFDVGLPRTDTALATVYFDYPGSGAMGSDFGDQRRKLRPSRRHGHRTRGSFDHEPIALFFQRRPPFVRGGPFVAVGGGWGTTRALRLRAGWEVAAPRWLVFSGAVESDTTDLRFVPAVSVMGGHSWFPLFLPGAAIGVGMPVETDRDVGFRAQAELFWYVVGIVGALDVYPEPGGARLVGSLMGQVSF